MGRPWMPLYCADFIGDTTHLSAGETGAYLLLIMHYWTKGGLPSDDKQLARIARMTSKEWSESRSTIAAFFREDWTHGRIDREMVEAGEAYERRAKAGKSGGFAKAKNQQKSSSLDSNATAENVAMLKQSQPQSSNEDKSSLRSDRACDEKSIERSPKNPPRQFPFPVKAFELWYEPYPEKTGRGAAEKAFEAVRKSDSVSFETLVSALERYIRNKPKDRAWCNPATWLNQKRWDDQPALDLRSTRDVGEPKVNFGGGFDWPETSVRAAVERWKADPRSWPHQIGPPPGVKGCLVPARLLPSFEKENAA